MKEQTTALILAGGFATRLWPLTEKRAKPLLPLAGKPLIQHILEKIPAGIPVIISTNQVFRDDFQELLKLFPERKITIFIEDSTQEKTKKGALGATALVIEEFNISSPLLLIAGDNYFGFSIEDFLGKYTGNTLLASFDTKSLQDAKQFGVLEVSGNQLMGFEEKPENPRSTLISTGCYLFSPQHLGFIQEYSKLRSDNLGGIFEYLLQKQEHVEVVTFTQPWIDIGSFESYLSAHRLLSTQNRISERSELRQCQIGEAVEIGDDCVLEDCDIEHSIVMEGCRISNARIRGCIIDRNCVIEGVDLDHKMIRAGAVIRG